MQKQIYAIPLRLIVGFGFMQHGFSKLTVGTHHLLPFFMLSAFRRRSSWLVSQSSSSFLAVTASGAQFGPPGYETNILYLACLAALVLGGSGPLAIDRLFCRRSPFAKLRVTRPQGDNRQA